MPQLLARSQPPVTLARGEHDAMSTDEQLTRLGVPTVTLPGLGHNARREPGSHEHPPGRGGSQKPMMLGQGLGCRVPGAGAGGIDGLADGAVTSSQAFGVFH
jgi:hypothetical protein